MFFLCIHHTYIPVSYTHLDVYKRQYPQFMEKGAVVLGVSKDTVASHKKFAEKYHLPFTLLSDTELKVIRAYDVWKEKNMYGNCLLYTSRYWYLELK